MGLPRPINWLREAAINEEHLSEVQKAAQAVKQALDDAQESLSQMESDNADQVQNLNQSLSEAMSNIVGQSGGAPTRMFIVYQWWGFADEAADRIETDNDIEDGEAVAERIRAERYLAIPFRTPEMAASYLNSKIEFLQSIAERGFYLSPEQEEDTPSDVLSRIILRDDNGNVIGYSELKYWQYNADQPIPEEAGGGTGDWV
jgi:hypothetical protein|tara:strand:- start:10465 stop:11070 length:606 start_codon:yes stop_codon:yes gene_type:complete